MLYNQPFGVSDPNAAYINGNPSTGTMGSIPPAASIEFDQREIVGVISYANATGRIDYNGVACAPPSNSDLLQLTKAIFGMAHGGAERALTGVRLYATPGSYAYTPSVGTRAVLVEVQAAGGSGSGSWGTNSSQMSTGIAGGAGGYGRKWITSGFAGVTVTVGAGGPGGGSTGNNGGSSSFGAILSCTGGQGGALQAGPLPATTIGNTTTASGGFSTGGDINVPGQCSQASLALNGAALSGVAGSCMYGSSGIAFGVSSDGSPGNGYGAGGTAAVGLASSGPHNGGAGAGGLVLIWEYA